MASERLMIVCAWRSEIQRQGEEGIKLMASRHSLVVEFNGKKDNRFVARSRCSYSDSAGGTTIGSGKFLPAAAIPL